MSRAAFSVYPIVGQRPRDGGNDPRTALSQAAYIHRARFSWAGREYDGSRFAGDLAEAIGLFPDFAPAWIDDTASCWGRLDEAAEHCHTQLRGFHICADLPGHEPSSSWAWTAHDLLRLVEPKGVNLVADVCFHIAAKHPSHAHILLAGRILEENGFGSVLPGMDQILRDLCEQWYEWLGLDTPWAHYPPDADRPCRTCRRRDGEGWPTTQGFGLLKSRGSSSWSRFRQEGLAE